jgi:tetratricopeptide (TPR) repeat protein
LEVSDETQGLRFHGDATDALTATKLARASLYWLQQRFQRALPMSKEAAAEYQRRGNVIKYFEATEVVALILHRMGDVGAACNTYRNLFAVADDLENSEMKARTAKALGVACRDVGEFGEASKYLLIALQLYNAMDKPAMALRMRWTIARTTLAAGNISGAISQLQQVIDAFENQEMKQDAHDAKVDLAEAYFLTDKIDEAETMLNDAVAYYRSQDIITAALPAVSFLKECAARKRLSRERFAHVRKFLDDLKRDRVIAFTPPADVD